MNFGHSSQEREASETIRFVTTRDALEVPFASCTLSCLRFTIVREAVDADGVSEIVCIRTYLERSAIDALQQLNFKHSL